MYVQPIFAETEPDVLHDLIRRHPLGSLVAVTDGGLEANHIPFELDAEGGCLRGHVSRGNPLATNLTPGQEVMILFHGPSHYISPSWQPGSKTHRKVAPSWNYAVVHAYGRVSLAEDADWLGAHLERLIDGQEHGRQEPWALDHADPPFVANLKRHIVGLDVEVSRLVGKWQACQQYSPSARDGIVAGLLAEATPMGPPMGELVRARAPAAT